MHSITGTKRYSEFGLYIAVHLCWIFQSCKEDSLQEEFEEAETLSSQGKT